MTWPEVTGIISVLFLLFGTWLTVRSDKAKSDKTVGGQQWNDLLQRHEQWQSTQQKRISDLERDLCELRDRFDGLERRYRAAVSYIRRLVAQLRQHVPAEAIERPPADIEIDIE